MADVGEDAAPTGHGWGLPSRFSLVGRRSGSGRMGVISGSPCRSIKGVVGCFFLFHSRRRGGKFIIFQGNRYIVRKEGLEISEDSRARH